MILINNIITTLYFFQRFQSAKFRIIFFLSKKKIIFFEILFSWFFRKYFSYFCNLINMSFRLKRSGMEKSQIRILKS